MSRPKDVARLFLVYLPAQHKSNSRASCVTYRRHYPILRLSLIAWKHQSLEQTRDRSAQSMRSACATRRARGRAERARRWGGESCSTASKSLEAYSGYILQTDVRMAAFSIGDGRPRTTSQSSPAPAPATPGRPIRMRIRSLHLPPGI